jgi:hypothetical protein
MISIAPNINERRVVKISVHQIGHQKRGHRCAGAPYFLLGLYLHTRRWALQWLRCGCCMVVGAGGFHVGVVVCLLSSVSLSLMDRTLEGMHDTKI